MNLQHFLTAQHWAKERGAEITRPEPHDDGFECSVIRDGVAVYTAIRSTENAAIQACIDDVLK